MSGKYNAILNDMAKKAKIMIDDRCLLPYSMAICRQPINTDAYIKDIEIGMRERGFDCHFREDLGTSLIFELTPINKPMKPFGSYIYLTEFNADIVGSAVNCLSKQIDEIVAKYGPAHKLEWVIKEYPPGTPNESDEDGKAVGFSKKTMWSIGWKAMFEVENEQKL